LILSSGGTATLAPESVVREAPFLIALETRQQPRGGALVTQAAAIELEWLLEINPDGMVSSDELSWNGKSERVERLRKTRYGALTLEEKRDAAPPSTEAAAILLKAAQGAGLDHFIPDGNLKTLQARCELLARHCPEAGVTPLDDAALAEFLRTACDDATSFAELVSRCTLPALVATLPSGAAPPKGTLSARQNEAAAQTLARLAPETFDLPGRKKVPIQYVSGQPPALASRLQDFFRLKKPPAVGDGRVPLTLHLLAPNQRAVQVTSDLDGFWEKHYPKLRLSLMRRYPRHQWPEDPKK
jgi:ATP-dependent helicase HrpB